MMLILPPTGKRRHPGSPMDHNERASRAAPEALQAMDADGQKRKGHFFLAGEGAVDCSQRDIIGGPHLPPPTLEWVLIRSIPLPRDSRYREIQ